MLLGDRVRWSRVEVASTEGLAPAILVAVLREARTTLLGRGDPDAALHLVRERLEGRERDGRPTTAGWMSLPRGASTVGGGDDVPGPVDALLGRLGLERFSTWDWMVTADEPPAVEAEDAVVRLDPVVDADAIRACLAEANPGTTADPTGPQEAAWCGVRDGDVLVGVMGASLRGGSDEGGLSWHLHGLGVRPRARGRDLGAALTAAVTRAGLSAGAEWVSLGLYADNERARGIYRRLGYATEGEFVSFGPAGARRPPT
ncbi:GNAT family N-acetyltransferase [Actinotalea solisilvae]|uniref:GNAT family N-acetyltransferase n=1 Tax=Actinotalea solisilvae TaxID=2072922 RepID=UPI0018F23DB3|nr:GNAT family N-acetyltransferase [Actinotalea solisilvae]